MTPDRGNNDRVTWLLRIGAFTAVAALLALAVAVASLATIVNRDNERRKAQTVMLCRISHTLHVADAAALCPRAR